MTNRAFIFPPLFIAAQKWAASLFPGVIIPMCKECARTNCRDKNKPPAKCERFLRYEDSAKFTAYKKLMESNRGVIVKE